MTRMQNPFTAASQQVFTTGPAFWDDYRQDIRPPHLSAAEWSAVLTAGALAIEEGAAFLHGLCDVLARTLTEIGVPAFACPHPSYREDWRGLIHLPSPANRMRGLIMPSLEDEFRIVLNVWVRNNEHRKTLLAGAPPAQRSDERLTLQPAIRMASLEDIEQPMSEAVDVLRAASRYPDLENILGARG